MAAPTLAEFTTTIPSISEQVFSPKDLQCLRIFALAAVAAQGIGVAVTDFSSDLANSSTSLVKVAMALIGNIPPDRMKLALTKSVCYRCGNGNVTGTASAALVIVKKLRECNQHEIDAAEAYITSLMLQSVGLQ